MLAWNTLLWGKFLLFYGAYELALVMASSFVIAHISIVGEP